MSKASFTAGRNNKEFINNAEPYKIAVGGRHGTKTGNTTNYLFGQGYINPLNTAMVIIGILFGIIESVELPTVFIKLFERR